MPHSSLPGPDPMWFKVFWTYNWKVLTDKQRTLKCKEWTGKRNSEKEMNNSCSVWASVLLYNNGASGQPSLQPNTKIALQIFSRSHLIVMIFYSMLLHLTWTIYASLNLLKCFMVQCRILFIFYVGVELSMCFYALLFCCSTHLYSYFCLFYTSQSDSGV